MGTKNSKKTVQKATSGKRSGASSSGHLSKKRASGNKNVTGKRPADKAIIAVNPSGQREESFFELVYEVARQIPRGRVTSYGAIAACLGSRLSARMVGWALNSAHTAKPRVPAHRVVNRKGLLTGKHHFATPDLMQELLEKEGIKVEDDAVADFKRLFWDPSSLV